MAARKRIEATPMAIHESWFDTPTMLLCVSHEYQRCRKWHCSLLKPSPQLASTNEASSEAEYTLRSFRSQHYSIKEEVELQNWFREVKTPPLPPATYLVITSNAKLGKSAPKCTYDGGCCQDCDPGHLIPIQGREKQGGMLIDG